MTSEAIQTEYFSDKLKTLQQQYDNLTGSYQKLIHEYVVLKDKYQVLERDYECCVLDLTSSRNDACRD